MLDVCFTIVEKNCHNIKSARAMFEVMLKEIAFRHFMELSLFVRIHSLDRFTVGHCPTGFHFDKHQFTTIFRHNIDFSALEPVIPLKHLQTILLEKLGRKRLPHCPSLLTLVF